MSDIVERLRTCVKDNESQSRWADGLMTEAASIIETLRAEVKMLRHTWDEPPPQSFDLGQ